MATVNLIPRGTAGFDYLCEVVAVLDKAINVVGASKGDAIMDPVHRPAVVVLNSYEAHELDRLLNSHPTLAEDYPYLEELAEELAQGLVE